MEEELFKNTLRSLHFPDCRGPTLHSNCWKALHEIRAEGTTCVFTFGGEVQEPQAPPMPQNLRWWIRRNWGAINRVEDTWRFHMISRRLWLWHAEFLWIKEVWWMKMTSCLLPFGPLGTSRWLVARIGKLRGGTVPPSDGRLRKIDTFAKESIALWKHSNPKHRSNSREGVDVLHYFYSNFFAWKTLQCLFFGWNEFSMFWWIRPSFPFPLASASWHHGIGIASLFPWSVVLMESLRAMVSWACRSLVPKALRALRVLAQRWWRKHWNAEKS